MQIKPTREGVLASFPVYQLLQMRPIESVAKKTIVQVYKPKLILCFIFPRIPASLKRVNSLNFNFHKDEGKCILRELGIKIQKPRTIGLKIPQRLLQ